MTTNTGQQREKSWDKNAGAGQLAQDSGNRKAPRQNSQCRQPEKTVGMIQEGQEREDKMAKT
jgi:hypothetical protein